jgi:hypothetical protein
VGPGTEDFPIRDFGACINLPDFTVVSNPDRFNTEYEVPGLFTIHFAEYLMPVASPPNNSDEIYGAMVALLETVNASDFSRIGFVHFQYVSAAVEFTLDGKRMFGMIYRNQDDRLFFLFADKVEGFDMLAIGRAIFAADRRCKALELAPAVPSSGTTDTSSAGGYSSGSDSGQSTTPGQNQPGIPYDSWPDFCSLACSKLTCEQVYQCGGHPDRDADRDGRACESQCW